MIHRMSKSQLFADILVLIFAFLFLLAIWNTDISIETQSIPTILNGLTSSISLIVGLTATVVTIAFSRSFKLAQDWFRIGFTVVTLWLPIVLLCIAYLQLMEVKYQLALKTAMIGLVISLSLLGEFLSFLYVKTQTMEQD